MFKVVKKEEAILRKIGDNKTVFNYITKEFSPNVSLVTAEGKDYSGKEKTEYDRIYFVLNGELILTIDNAKITLRPEDSCLISKDTEPIKGEKTKAINGNYTRFVESSKIAIEIPVNWTTIQGNNIQLAQEWRGITDNIFQEYIGLSEGKYAITDVATIREDGVISSAFLIGQSIDQIDRVFFGEV